MNPPTPIRNFPNLDYHLTDFFKSRYNVGSSIQTLEEDSLGLLGFPGGLVVKNPPAVQETESIPESGRYSGGEHGNTLQYSCLENPMDRGAWSTVVHGIARSWT